jgi:hypothetical protein
MDPVMVVGIILVIVVIFVFSLPIYGQMRRTRALKGPKFDGPPFTGTARVLSVEGTWGVTVSTLCRIGLRVEIPGHPPYDVTVKTPIPSAELYTMFDTRNQINLRGRTVAVQVDSANPRNVRIDFNQPIT